jgi:hypothetical protein
MDVTPFGEAVREADAAGLQTDGYRDAVRLSRGYFVGASLVATAIR